MAKLALVVFGRIQGFVFQDVLLQLLQDFLAVFLSI